MLLRQDVLSHPQPPCRQRSSSDPWRIPTAALSAFLQQTKDDRIYSSSSTSSGCGGGSSSSSSIVLYCIVLYSFIVQYKLTECKLYYIQV